MLGVLSAEDIVGSCLVNWKTRDSIGKEGIWGERKTKRSNKYIDMLTNCAMV